MAPVCGSDGQTYSSKCSLYQQACANKKDVDVLYSGICRPDNHKGDMAELCQGCPEVGSQEADNVKNAAKVINIYFRRPLLSM